MYVVSVGGFLPIKKETREAWNKGSSQLIKKHPDENLSDMTKKFSQTK